MSAVAKQQQIPGARDVTNAEYHTETEHLSHSSLDVFGESKELYHARYITKTIAQPEPSKAMALGTAFHAYVLQPNVADSLLALDPEGNRNSNAYKDARKALEAELGDRTIVTTEQRDMARRMADSLWAIPDARAILEAPGWYEQSVFVEVEEPRWIVRGNEIPDTYVLPSKRKAQFDKIFETGHIAELKTTCHHHIDGFQRDIFNYGYHRAAPWYEDVRDLALGPHRGTFFYLVACTDPPHEAFVRPLSERAKAAGRIENHALLTEYNACVESGVWSNQDRGPQELDIPSWAHRKIEGR